MRHRADLFSPVPEPSCTTEKPTTGRDGAGEERAAMLLPATPPLANFPPAHSQPSCQGEQEELVYAYHKELQDFHAAQWGSDEEDGGEDVPDEPPYHRVPIIRNLCVFSKRPLKI